MFKILESICDEALFVNKNVLAVSLKNDMEEGELEDASSFISESSTLLEGDVIATAKVKLQNGLKSLGKVNMLSRSRKTVKRKKDLSARNLTTNLK